MPLNMECCIISSGRIIFLPEKKKKKKKRKPGLSLSSTSGGGKPQTELNECSPLQEAKPLKKEKGKEKKRKIHKLDSEFCDIYIKIWQNSESMSMSMSMSTSTATKSTVQETSSEPPPALRPVKPETPGAGVETRDAATATPPATTKATGALNYPSDAHVPSYSSMSPSLPYLVIYPCFCLFFGYYSRKYT